MHTSLTDENIIRLYLPNQPNECFETLYTRYVNKVYRRCLSLTHDSAKAEDFTHDIFLKVFDKLDAFQERARFSTWLYSIAYNYCLDQIRLSKRLNTVTMDDDYELDIADNQESVLHEETLQMVKQAMDTLSKEETTLLRMKYEDGMSIDEIADLYNLKASAVKMRLKRSRDKIHRLYEQQYNS
ncbi:MULTISPECIES: RNA polymerase sigma factor [Spirosoma]|uniref:RNA polymerase sigma factor n=1 Tax=Spirosoma liriopis TaxID=2937440 RepID=A0ABT0HG27_9BACT|nr:MULTISPECIES: RNA polymerase sigma factor [Spirosoma]MCK8491112.1 RNA polymerase sigma factor [Spirosoma liriopis]UHG90494.1 RNA polymerase sigma factor [Spirosoma oryzicola]